MNIPYVTKLTDDQFLIFKRVMANRYGECGDVIKPTRDYDWEMNQCSDETIAMYKKYPEFQWVFTILENIPLVTARKYEAIMDFLYNNANAQITDYAVLRNNVKDWSDLMEDVIKRGEKSEIEKIIIPTFLYID